MYLGHKHVETGPNFSYGIYIFLKYHMLLRKVASSFEQFGPVPTCLCEKKKFLPKFEKC